jgi:hypothetical protein
MRIDLAAIPLHMRLFAQACAGHGWPFFPIGGQALFAAPILHDSNPRIAANEHLFVGGPDAA